MLMSKLLKYIMCIGVTISSIDTALPAGERKDRDERLSAR